ncbi:lysophospholipid acyltransferase family protein [Rubellimicrobium arenae]|uniref:lysophospholipid acyltransferase family protein n=1 Tax=Rubellimicrobium arenae TaxID=2817372 RepID=UPI001B308CC9|nr:lysophospholipid acyltransferase family protein [Rubellimicrobium arenae]
MTRFFSAIMARQMASSFRAVRLARPGLPDLPRDRPLVVYSNHPSWWDPAFYIVLHSRLFPGRDGYGPMEEAMLKRYGFFRRVGIFGVSEGRSGAARFLNVSQAILSDPGRMLWVTAQGRFADPRERPLGLRPGVAHLMARMPQAVAVPLALEYPFWSEKRPEALALFGQPLEGPADAAGWGRRLEDALTGTCDHLAALSAARDPSAFVNLLAGTSGVGGVYGAWLRLKALRRGERHVPDHLAEEP